MGVKNVIFVIIISLKKGKKLGVTQRLVVIRGFIEYFFFFYFVKHYFVCKLQNSRFFLS